VFPNAKKLHTAAPPSLPAVADLLAAVNGSLHGVEHTPDTVHAVGSLPGSVTQPVPPILPFCSLVNRIRLSVKPGDAIILYNMDAQLVRLLQSQ
jgi:hypothetical protein